LTPLPPFPPLPPSLCSTYGILATTLRSFDMKLRKNKPAATLQLHRETLYDLSSLRRATAGASIMSCDCETSTVRLNCTVVTNGCTN
jgi:hypothetical protein